MSQKSQNQKFKCKYFVGVIAKFQPVALLDSCNSKKSEVWRSPSFVFVGLPKYLREKQEAVFNNAAYVYCWTLFSNTVLSNRRTGVSRALSWCYCTKEVKTIFRIVSHGSPMAESSSSHGCELKITVSGIQRGAVRPVFPTRHYRHCA
jgi:hypothetical protein